MIYEKRNRTDEGGEMKKTSELIEDLINDIEGGNYVGRYGRRKMIEEYKDKIAKSSYHHFMELWVYNGDMGRME